VSILWEEGTAVAPAPSHPPPLGSGGRGRCVTLHLWAQTLYRVAEAEGALPAAGGARGAAAAGESVIATRARELQQQHQQEHQEQEPERGADAPTPSLTPEAVEDDLAGALGVLSGHLAHLTARFGKGRGGARRPAPLDALKPVPRAGGPAGRVASPLLGASLRAGGARARPQSAMGRL